MTKRSYSFPQIPPIWEKTPTLDTGWGEGNPQVRIGIDWSDGKEPELMYVKAEIDTLGRIRILEQGKARQLGLDLYMRALRMTHQTRR